ncbi:MAG: hypothetical protein MJE77_06515 [Proteobacteria bacterium]|nr:hypothetical protein [Pseudomonadota bacterium]
MSHHRLSMVIPRILTAQSLLDKLRYWIALPLGAAAGSVCGYWIGQPGIENRDIVLTVASLVLVLWLGLSAPRAVGPKS